MSISLVTAGGEIHGKVNVLTNNVKFNEFKGMSSANKLKIEKEKKEDARIVKAEYMNSRGRHERLSKIYCRYAGDPIEQWNCIPGYVYDVPVGMIKEVNDPEKGLRKREGLESIDGNTVNPNGTPLSEDQKPEWIHKFVPVGF